MRKKLKKLSLNRETVRKLNVDESSSWPAARSSAAEYAELLGLQHAEHVGAMRSGAPRRPSSPGARSDRL